MKTSKTSKPKTTAKRAASASKSKKSTRKVAKKLGDIYPSPATKLPRERKRAMTSKKR